MDNPIYEYYFQAILYDYNTKTTRTVENTFFATCENDLRKRIFEHYHCSCIAKLIIFTRETVVL